MFRVLIPQNLQTLPPQLPIGTLRTLTGQSMGTSWAVRFVNTNQQTDDVRGVIQHELNLVVAQMSTWQADSNLSIFNRADAIHGMSYQRHFLKYWIVH